MNSNFTLSDEEKSEIEKAPAGVVPQPKKQMDDAFARQTHQGTSFASPAVASVYLCLHQFADQVNSGRSNTADSL